MFQSTLGLAFGGIVAGSSSSPSSSSAFNAAFITFGY